MTSGSLQDLLVGVDVPIGRAPTEAPPSPGLPATVAPMTRAEAMRAMDENLPGGSGPSPDEFFISDPTEVERDVLYVVNQAMEGAGIRAMPDMVSWLVDQVAAATRSGYVDKDPRYKIPGITHLAEYLRRTQGGS